MGDPGLARCFRQQIRGGAGRIENHAALVPLQHENSPVARINARQVRLRHRAVQHGIVQYRDADAHRREALTSQRLSSQQLGRILTQREERALERQAGAQ